MERNKHGKDVKFLQQIAQGIFVRLCFYWRGNLLTTIAALSAKQTPRGRAEAAQGHQQPQGEIQPRTGAGCRLRGRVPKAGLSPAGSWLGAGDELAVGKQCSCPAEDVWGLKWFLFRALASG